MPLTHVTMTREHNLSVYYSIIFPIMLALSLCLPFLACGHAPIKREEESSEVKSPAVGDTIALTEPRYGPL